MILIFSLPDQTASGTMFNQPRIGDEMRIRAIRRSLAHIGIFAAFLFTPTQRALFARVPTADETALQRESRPLDTRLLQQLRRSKFYGIYLAGTKAGWAKTELVLADDGGEARWQSSTEEHVRMLWNDITGTMPFESQWEFDTQEPFSLRKVRYFEIWGESSRETILTQQSDGSFLAVIRDGDKCAGEIEKARKLSTSCDF